MLCCSNNGSRHNHDKSIATFNKPKRINNYYAASYSIKSEMELSVCVFVLDKKGAYNTIAFNKWVNSPLYMESIYY